MATRRTGGFTDEEKAAMRERAKEVKAGAGESDLLAKIAEMQEPDRGMAECFHAIVTASATRYSTLGFSDKANLDEGAMWPTSYALRELTAAEEERIAALVKQAAS